MDLQAKTITDPLRQCVSWFNFKRLLKQFTGPIDHAFGQIGASEVEVRKVPGFIPFCSSRALEPGDGFVKAFEADQVGADIVVRVAEIRINLDGALAFGDRLLNLSLKVEGPTEKGMGLYSRM